MCKGIERAGVEQRTAGRQVCTQVASQPQNTQGVSLSAAVTAFGSTELCLHVHTKNDT